MPSGESLRGEGLVYLIGAVVCLLAACRGSNCTLTRAMDGRSLCCSTIGSCQSTATSYDCTARLVAAASSADLYLYPPLNCMPATPAPKWHVWCRLLPKECLPQISYPTVPKMFAYSTIFMVKRRSQTLPLDGQTKNVLTFHRQQHAVPGSPNSTSIPVLHPHPT